MIDGNTYHAEKELKPMMLTAAQVAGLLGISTRTLWRLRSAAEMPAPVRLGSSVRWRLEDINNWVGAGCPPREAGNNNRRRT